jgi:NAD(P)-dependent dehydrogenase (short-subunit alcohol dehydrogenase family)
MTHDEPMLRAGALRGRTILVTGGGSGLGKSMSRCFLELGARVAIASRSEERLAAAAKELHEATGGEVLPVACDIRDYDQVERAIAAVAERFGSLDTLVNNAAGNFIAPTERLSNRAFDAVVDIVLKGSYHCTLAAGKHMIERGTRGCMLSIVTSYAWTGSGYVVPSACAKAGVLALTRSLAVEWGTQVRYPLQRHRAGAVPDARRVRAPVPGGASAARDRPRGPHPARARRHARGAREPRRISGLRLRGLCQR